MGLQLNKDKTHLLTDAKDFKGWSIISSIKIVTEAKYLGVTFVLNRQQLLASTKKHIKKSVACFRHRV